MSKTIIEAMKNEDAYMLTKYATPEGISIDDYIKYYMHERISFDTSNIEEYNEFLIYSHYFEFDYLEQFLDNKSPYDAFRLGCFSDINWSHDYFKYDDNRNLRSYSKYQVLEEMSNNDDFLDWYFENYINTSTEKIIETIEDCKILLSAGIKRGSSSSEE